MPKLTYKTKPPRKGFVFYQSDSTHEIKPYETLPSEEVQKKAMSLVDDKMRDLLNELESLGYDPTKVRFQIYTK